MSSYIKKHVDNLFQLGLEKGDLLWFINIVVSNVTTNCCFFSASYTCVLFCSIEIIGGLYMLTEKPSLDQILGLAPMICTSLYVLSCCTHLTLGRYKYKRIYKAYLDLWPLLAADKEGVSEFRTVFYTFQFWAAIFCPMFIIGEASFIPYHEDIETTVWPALAALNLVPDLSDSVKYSVLLINYVFIFLKFFFMLIYFFHFMHICILYQAQCILLKRRINRTRCSTRTISDIKLVDNERYQTWVTTQLKDCIKLDVKLRRISFLIISYFKWNFCIHVADCIFILSLIYYIIIAKDGFCPIGLKMFLFAGQFAASLYGYYSEMFYEQMGNTLEALFGIPWYTFNKANKVLLHNFAVNLTKPQFLTAGGVFDINFSLLIWVFHKIFNVLTVLLQMMENNDQ